VKGNENKSSEIKECTWAHTSQGVETAAVSHLLLAFALGMEMAVVSHLLLAFALAKELA
jgi:hypothetical protein